MFRNRMLRAFARNRDGGVAPMLALAALPLFGFVGASIDFSRASAARTAMQGALDAAALMMAKDAKNVDAAQLTANATTYFNANFQNSEVQNLQPTVSSSSTSGGYAVNMTVTGQIQTRFMGIIGFSVLNLTVHSTAVSNADGLGCVLALDGHMSGSATAQEIGRAHV